MEISASDRLYADSLLDQDLDLNVNLNPDLCLDPLLSTSSLPTGTVSDLCSLTTQPNFNGNNGYREPILDCFTLPAHLANPTAPQSLSTPPFEVPEPERSPLTTPPNPTTLGLCLTQNRPLCITTATQSLRSLHIPQSNCLSRRNGSHSQNEHNSPRISGSVLKCNKDAEMAVWEYAAMRMCPPPTEPASTGNHMFASNFMVPCNDPHLLLEPPKSVRGEPT